MSKSKLYKDKDGYRYLIVEDNKPTKKIKRGKQLPEGKPNGFAEFYEIISNIIHRVRFFDSNGKARKDYDFSSGYNQKEHTHEFTGTMRSRENYNLTEEDKEFFNKNRNKKWEGK